MKPVLTKRQSKIAARKQREAISKIDVESAKYKEQIHRIQREGKIAVWNDYIGFTISKLLGIGALIIGGIESLDPNILSITLKNPEAVAGLGLALLTGKSVISLIAKLEKSQGGR
jgi:hypothetical protein